MLQQVQALLVQTRHKVVERLQLILTDILLVL
jgi:hypothetical protein